MSIPDEVWQELRDRLTAADVKLRDLAESGCAYGPERVAGKAEGCRLALSYMDEYDRDLTRTH